MTENESLPEHETQRKRGRPRRDEAAVEDAALRPLDDDETAVLATTARALIDDPAFRQANIRLMDDLVREWRGSRPDEVTKRESLYAEVQALKRITIKLDGLHKEYTRKNYHRSSA